MSYRGKTDRRFNDWHYTLPVDWWYIDLDGVEVCRQCRSPLLLYEVTRDPNKAVTILARLAAMAGIPAVLMLLPDETEAPQLDESSVVRWNLIGSKVWTRDTLASWRAWLADLRAEHSAEHHPRRLVMTI